MRVRHKPPTFVSMWMLDVFCCALGCVTLLWLLNTRQAGDQTAAARSAIDDLTQAKIDLKLALTVLDSTKLRLNSDTAEYTRQLAAVRADKASLARKLGLAQDEAKSAAALLDATKVALNAAEAKIDANAKELAAARDKTDSAEDLLVKRQKDADALAKKLTAAAATADDLNRLIRKKDEERLVLEKRVADMQKLLDDVDAKLRASKKDVDAAAATAKTAAAAAADELKLAKADAAKAIDDAAKSRSQIKDVQKKLDDANVMIVDLQGDKAKLADKVNKIEKDTESRFAGITMTGKSVIFLVDMSGSMEKTDEKTVAPHKWPIVAETVAKVMRTIPNIERFQVILFSRSARWLVGNGEWQKYEGEKSVLGVKEAMLKVKPEGDTNMYAAFDLAFTLRAKGLDTIYLFSDGLPTSGPGLTAAQENANPPLRETERSEILSQFILSRTRTTWNRKLVGDERVKIHAIGFFYESPDVGAFLWALARDNDGSFVGMSRP